MWTPKRIMLLSIGFVLFTLVYGLYSLTSLGRINTLPPLPPQYSDKTQGEGDRTFHAHPTITPLEQKLERAFSKSCEELKWPVLLELNSKSMVMAAGTFSIETDGRVKLEPMSLAIFGKKKNPTGEVEINTLKCKHAYITFDQPIKTFSPSELNGRKIKKAELYGEGKVPIVLTNNRRTVIRDDDLMVVIPTGPLHYSEDGQLITTNDALELKDGWQLVPPKAYVTAKGMEMELATSAPPPKPGSPLVRPPKNESISGVKRIRLRQDVSMHLWTNGAAPLPGGAKDSPAPNQAKTPGNPTHIYIRTPGSFDYRLLKDHDLACFDVPEEAGGARSPQDVVVERLNDNQKGITDQLVCKHLELRLKRRGDSPTPGATPPPAATTSDQGLEVETAHATGPDVTLTSDAEKLDAHGNDFFYDTTKKLTILKGTPYMEANKEDSLIQAPELRIQEVPLPAEKSETQRLTPNSELAKAKTYQQIQASGPGCIHMLNKTTNKQTVHAFWNDKLISTRDGTMDLLILLGAARFVDDEHDQSLAAETMRVWLLAEEKKPVASAKPIPAKDKAQATPEQSRRPYRVEASRNVLAHSPTLTIHDAAEFVVRFTDVPASRMPPPSNNNKPGAALVENKPAATVSLSPAPVVSNASPAPTTTPPAKTATLAAPTNGETNRPLDLTAQRIEADVLRCDERMALDHLYARGGPIDSINKQGGVRVRQEPAKPEERGIYIESYTLDMRCYPGGNVLVVTGDTAQLEMDKIIIVGPEVHIDQVQNKAWVYGGGAMQMQSNSTLDGKPLSRTVPLNIYWSKEMVFWGEFAEFFGNIQAVQENARLACQTLQVYFDRPISLKEGAKSDRPPKVRNLYGDKEVRVEDRTMVGDQLQKYQRLDGNVISMNSEPRDEEPGHPSGKSSDANKVTLSGPGTVRLMQRGGADPLAAPGKPAPNSAPAKATESEQVMKMTYVSFEQVMQASTRTNVASFWGSVRVLNFPCDDERREIDLDDLLTTELPPGAMYLRSNVLWVRSYKKQDKSYQEMEAKGRVYVQSQEFTAQCDHMTFNEEKDQVIFLGENGNVAVLSKVTIKGALPQTFTARKIIYNRTTGEVNVDKINSIRSFGG